MKYGKEREYGMTVFQCKMCGANLNITSRTQVIVCEYCGTPQTPFEGNRADGDESAFLQRAFHALEDGDFVQANSFCEQALNINPENAQAYLCKLRAELGLQVWDDLRTRPVLIHANPNYNRIMQFADESLKEEISKIAEWNKELMYMRVQTFMSRGKRQRLANHTAIVEILVALGDYKDSKKLLEEQYELNQNTSEKTDRITLVCAGAVVIVMLLIFFIMESIL